MESIALTRRFASVYSDYVYGKYTSIYKDTETGYSVSVVKNKIGAQYEYFLTLLDSSGAEVMRSDLLVKT